MISFSKEASTELKRVTSCNNDITKANTQEEKNASLP